MERSLYPRMVAAVLALLGLFDALYLTLNHYLPSISLVCPVGGGCETVQTSRWSTLPPGSGIPVALVGVVGYALLLLIALVVLQRDSVGRLALPTLLLLIASGGLSMSIYLVILQLVVIRAICFWCMVSALLESGIWLAAWLDWRRWRASSKTITTPDAQPHPSRLLSHAQASGDRRGRGRHTI